MALKNSALSSIILASATSGYKAAAKKITVTAIPEQMGITAGKWLEENKKAYFKWTKPKGADGYQIDLSYMDDFRESSKAEITGKNSMTMTIHSIASTKTYVRVRAYKKIGSKRYYGA